jgi:aspartate/methionine/tyrosine aminotransferase
MPDVKDIRDKVHFDANVAGLLIINPDNPTGAVYPHEVLEEFVAIAKEYNLFLIADEIYANLAYDPGKYTSLAEVAGEVPTMIMRGLSKEVPWPGSRCGWVEFYNTNKDKDFARYAKSIENAKMNEVCSTTLPQAVLPAILGDKRYAAHLAARRKKYAKRGEEAVRVLGAHSAFDVVMPKGAFYLSVTLSKAFLQKPVEIQAANEEAQKLLDEELKKIPQKDVDKRFCYQLMAKTGVCVVPLSTGFNSSFPGFRMTLLEQNDATFTQTLQSITTALS